MVRSLYDQLEEPDWKERYKCIFRSGAIATFVIVQLISVGALLFSSFDGIHNIFTYLLLQSLLSFIFYFVLGLSYYRFHHGDGGQYTIPPIYLGGSALIIQAFGLYGFIMAKTNPPKDPASNAMKFVLCITLLSIIINSIVGIWFVVDAIRTRCGTSGRADRRMYSLAATRDFELDDIDGNDVEFDLEAGVDTMDDFMPLPNTSSHSKHIATKSYSKFNSKSHLNSKKTMMSLSHADFNIGVTAQPQSSLKVNSTSAILHSGIKSSSETSSSTPKHISKRASSPRSSDSQKIDSTIASVVSPLSASHSANSMKTQQKIENTNRQSIGQKQNRFDLEDLENAELQLTILDQDDLILPDDFDIDKELSELGVESYNNGAI